MKSFFVLYFCLVFLPAIIRGIDSSGEESGNESDESYSESLIEILDRMAENGEIINEVLKLTPNGYLGEGGCSIVYKGIRKSDSKPVAIKFIGNDEEDRAKREYSIYTYLNAIDNADVERFGVPAIYYYGHWDPYILMALSLCEESLLSKANKDELEKPLNNLIVFRQFVRQSKYLHSRGIRHDDVKAENIMIRNYQCFLIDYDVSCKLKEDTNVCTNDYKPRRCHLNCTRFAIDDWESFFYSMCYVNEVELKWLYSNKYDNLYGAEADRRFCEAKQDVKHIFRKVNAIKSEPLREVFMAFYNEIFGQQVKRFPDYDGIDNIIAAEIDKLVAPNKPVFFTWMNKKDIKKALKRMKKNPVPGFHYHIKEPSRIDFDTYTYPEVDFEYFNETSAGSSLSRCASSSSTSSSSTSSSDISIKRMKRSEITN